MIYFLLTFSVLHVGFYFVLAYGWFKIPTSSKTSKEQVISVIIPVRNEEKVIERVLTCLEYQDYDRGKYEVIVIDDFSDDKTLDLVRKCKENLRMNLRVFSLKDPEKSGKKHALTKGVELAKYDFIMTSDADCYVGPKWLSSYASNIRENKFIAGPVALKGSGFWAALQQVEFSGLIGFGAVTLVNNNPSMCSGANLGFSKDAFWEVGGYTDNLQIPSGDDEFLLFNIQKKYPGEVTFLKSKAAIVLTPVHETILGFINQRIRWTSKWKYNKNPTLRFMAVLFFFDYLVLSASIISAVFGDFQWSFILYALTIRWISNIIYVSPIHRFLGFEHTGLSLLVIQIIYPFHILFMGVNSIFGRYTWKGRKY